MYQYASSELLHVDIFMGFFAKEKRWIKNPLSKNTPRTTLKKVAVQQ